MRIAVDKDSIKAIKQDKNEYIYLFSTETLEELLATKLHCIHHEYVNYVDVNLTQYKVNCLKKTDPEDKDFDKLPPKRDYKFAIIVPNFNNDRGEYKGKTYLQKCIESILNQTYKNFELIYVDDCSTDTSVETVEKYKAKDKRIHMIKNIRKRYNGGSRNVGIEYAIENLEFDYFCFLDSDDWWKHEKVLEHINKLLYNHELMTIGCEQLFHSGTGGVKYNKPDEYEDLYSFNNKVWCTAWARVIRKDKIVYFCEDTLMEDRVWTYRLADGIEFKNTVALNEIVYVWNRMNTSNSVSLSRSDFWNASAYCHIGHQLQLISQMKHKEMIPKIKDRIAECKRKIDMDQFQQY